MSPRVVCALNLFKDREGNPECEKTFYKCRSWQKCCSRKCQKRLDYLSVKKTLSRGRRRMAKKRTAVASAAPKAHFGRVYCSTFIQPGQVRKALAGILAANPEVLERIKRSNGEA